jgi:hypothetical protein
VRVWAVRPWGISVVGVFWKRSGFWSSGFGVWVLVWTFVEFDWIGGELDAGGWSGREDV